MILIYSILLFILFISGMIIIFNFYTGLKRLIFSLTLTIILFVISLIVYSLFSIATSNTNTLVCDGDVITFVAEDSVIEEKIYSLSIEPVNVSSINASFNINPPAINANAMVITIKSGNTQVYKKIVTRGPAATSGEFDFNFSPPFSVGPNSTVTITLIRPGGNPQPPLATADVSVTIVYCKQ